MRKYRYRKPHRFRKKKPFFKKSFFSFLPLFLLIAGLSYFLFFSGFFEVKEIYVFGNKKVLKADIKRMGEEELNKSKFFFVKRNIFLADLTKIEENILVSFPQVSLVEVNRKFPGTLSFTIIEREGIGSFCKEEKEETDVPERCFILDQKGIVFEELESGAIVPPKIKKQDFHLELILGRNVIEESLLAGILRIHSSLEMEGIGTEEIFIVSEERIDVLTSEGWKIYLDPQDDLDWQLSKLKTVLERSIPKERTVDLEYIELRFGNFAPFKYKQED